MAKFRICIGGRVAEVTSLFDSTRDYCHRYLSEDTPDYSIAVQPSDLRFEQQALLEEALAEGLRPRTFPDPFLDRAAIQRFVAEHLFSDNILMVHGSLIAVDSEGFLFTAAKCGTGKSTHTRLWRQLMGDRAVMVNDDKPFLRLDASGILAYGAPWSGKHGLDTNITVPLKGICLLERGPENTIRPAAAEELLPHLIKESYCPPNAVAQHRQLVAQLAARVPLWRMACTKDISAARMAYAAMAGKSL